MHDDDAVRSLLRMSKDSEDPAASEPQKRSWKGLWEHYVKRGHEGKVNCVACSEGANYIVTGGEDYTMRIWRYDVFDEQRDTAISDTYDIRVVLDHDTERKLDKSHELEAEQVAQNDIDIEPRPKGVTAVACAGEEGPMISGTARGDVYATFVGKPPIPLVNLHIQCITEFAVPCGLKRLSAESSWYMAAASKDGRVSVMHFKDGECEILFLPHGPEVLGVRHIGQAEIGSEARENVATWVTQTKKDVFVWSRKETVPMFTLSEHLENTRVTDIAIANKVNGTLLFVGCEASDARRFLKVWAVEEGKFCDAYGFPSNEPVPVLTYTDNGLGIDVDQSENSTEFLVDLASDNYTARLWQLNPLSRKSLTQLAFPPKGSPAQWLIAAQNREVILELRHTAKITHMRAAFDPDDACGPCAIIACENGTIKLWDLEGFDRGEVYADLRSLKCWEIALPIVLLVTTFFQVAGFAFGPHIRWKEEVRRPVSRTRKIVMCEFFLELHVGEENLAMAAVTLTIGVMILVLLIVLTGLPEVVNSCIYKIQSTDWYRLEARKGNRGCMHTIKAMLQLMHSMLGLLILVCATVGVAPMYRWLAVSFAWCYEGKHIWFFLAYAIMVPVYSVLLIPLSAVEGQMEYMNWRKLFSPREFWAESARRKATVINMGPLHQNPEYVFRSHFLELCAKAILPVVEILAREHPGIQVSLTSSVGFIMWLTSLMYPPKQGRIFNCMAQDARLFTLCAMLCGSLVLLLDYLGITDSLIPIILLSICAIVVFAHTLYVLCTHPADLPRVYETTTSSVATRIDAQRSETHGNASRKTRTSVISRNVTVKMY